MQNNRYPKNSYTLLKASDDKADKIGFQNVLFTYGFGYIWIAQDVGDIGMFKPQFKQRLTDCMTQRWHADISGSSRCDTYKEFKSL